LAEEITRKTRRFRGWPSGLCLAATLALAVGIVERTWAQTKPATTAKPPAAGPKTTLAGIYTTAQAKQGEEIYYGMCISCHPKGTYAGAGFKTNWNNRPLWDLWDWISNKMPKNDPGSLEPGQVVQVMAYILQQNKMPAGTAPLPPNEKTLYGIKIQIK
jgi:mono/diheme cytochrome c family protein